LEESATVIEGKIAKDFEEIADAFAVHIVTMIGLHTVQES
jgi:hypothetical protein